MAERIVSRLRDEDGVEGILLSWEVCGIASGVFIAVEGIDGAGISTHSEILAHAFKVLLARGSEAAGLPRSEWHGAAYTKEPTYGPVGFLLYQIMKGGPYEHLKNPVHMALLFAADRHYHLYYEGVNGCQGIAGCIRGQPVPTVVVSDRYKYSSVAYQSVSIRAGNVTYKGAPMEWLWLLNSFAPPPHILVYLDVDPEIAIRRLSTERWSIQLYERLQFLQDVSNAFRRVIVQLEKTPEAVITRDRVDEVLLNTILRRSDREILSPFWVPWYKNIQPLCHYPIGRYPHVVKVRTGKDTLIEDNAYEILKTIINILADNNMIMIKERR